MGYEDAARGLMVSGSAVSADIGYRLPDRRFSADYVQM
jgi:hypothetical protein